VRVHEFKTRFYTEAIRRMLGPKGPVVRGYDVNTCWVSVSSSDGGRETGVVPAPAASFRRD